MIDDLVLTGDLIELMRHELPFTVTASARLRAAQPEGEPVPARLEVERVLYLGDEGGIMLATRVTRPDGTERRLVCSLTHVEVGAADVFCALARAYQKRRVKKLRTQDRAAG